MHKIVSGFMMQRMVRQTVYPRNNDCSASIDVKQQHNRRPCVLKSFDLTEGAVMSCGWCAGKAEQREFAKETVALQPYLARTSHLMQR